MDTKMMSRGDWSIALNQGGPNAVSDPRLLKRIGRELRSVYDEVVEAPVPDHLADILRRLDESGGENGE